ncbi:hypothetical protein EUX98_g4680 [Antrodiella citrinella]|uniref:Mid2 domain-containing protein n=1 Tax=Antrodiella citrinella TaxID=2447956 RepID=A0A4S4MU89_9APHY|nr:hypothetical protein EUX98_g4680 [Antrodiella citrinella]
MLGLSFALWTLVAAGVSGALVNRTIDDEFGDEVTGLQVCGAVVHSVRKSIERGIGTWHDGTYTPSHDDPALSFSFSFNGSAVYIFNILTRLTLTDVNITLDGNFVTNFNLFQNVSVFDQYAYNFPILALDSIPYGEHTVTVTTVGTNTSLLLFDYAVYTTNTTAASSSSQSQAGKGKGKTNVGAIVGGVVGGIVLLMICTIAGLLYRRRRTGKIRILAETTRPEPFSMSKNVPEEVKQSNVSIGRATATIPDDISAIEKSSSTADEAASLSLQQRLQFFRAELAILRSRAPSKHSNSAPTPPQDGSVTSSGTQGTDTSQAISSLAGQISALRAEIAQLRSHGDLPSPTIQSNDSGDMQREISLLRSEIDELRQEQLGPLPEYTPSPYQQFSPPLSRPLPSTPQ